jgi:hypothetical protein
MTAMRVTLEVGPKGKKVVAVAPDWPGLSRGASTEDAAIERLAAYRERYAPVVKCAGLTAEFAAGTDLDIVELYPGTGSTDFWGISFAFSEIDRQEMSRERLERALKLLRACWAFFDDVRSRVSPDMKRGIRGGGRDRDTIVRHTLVSELDMAKKVGVLTPFSAMLTNGGLTEHREAYCAAIRAHYEEGKLARKWPLSFLIRHTAFHTLDHAWEMEDKDLTVNAFATL